MISGLSTFASLLIIAVSFYLLYKGADILVKYSSLLAKHYGVTTLVIGLTIVALGTSMPEVVTVVIAAWQKNHNVAIGNIVGSNIANIGLILGLAALIRPINVKGKTLKREIPFMAGAALLLWLFSLDARLASYEGLVLLILAGIFIIYTVTVARRERLFDETVARIVGSLSVKGSGKKILMIIFGVALLILGAKLLVDSAVNLALDLGVDSYVIAVTLVAVGTSIPELAASVVAAIKNHGDIVLGNIVGSNIVNIFVALGLGALIAPIALEPRVIQIDIPLMIVFTMLTILFLRTKYRLTRLEGGILLIIYAIYVYSVIV